MEMKIFLINLALILTLASCTNTPELETGEIQILQLLKKSFGAENRSNIFIDSRTLLSRKQIDAANIPVLFVELKSGQNGTLTPYPGQGIGQTWLGADGATITTDRGILKASRGMGVDLMGSSLSMPPWAKINANSVRYERKLVYMTGNNKILELSLECKIQKNGLKETIKIWGVKFSVIKFDENCTNKQIKIKNTYFVDDRGIVRRSSQFHSDAIGYILTERLER